MMKCNDVDLAALLDEDEEHFRSGDNMIEIAQHVESCECCQSRLSELAADDRQWNELQTWLSPGELSANVYAESLDVCERWKRPTALTQSMATSLLSPPRHPEMLGRIGRYDVERLIGSGGMGVVFKAYDTELNRPVAVKLLAPYLSGSGAARNRFAREARAAAAVVDEHVVAIHNVESDSEHPFLVMKYIAGGSLQLRLDREGPLDVCEVLRIGLHTAQGLAAAHAQGLIHRDVKPSNILLDEGVERALLTDFGLARATDDASLTRSGFHPGTPHYMSPEQVRGEAIDPRSDLFGLGCVLYAMCTGHPPFRGEASYAVLRRITDDTPRSTRETNPNIPPWLDQIVMTLLAKSPEDRFESAEQVAEMLENCLAHTQNPTTTSLPEFIATLAPRQIERRRWTKFLAAAVFAFSLLFAGVLTVLELNKGTLTIESEADDVPIRIIQGDEVVRRLTVTKGAETVRIATGPYVVEIDGKTSGLKVDGETVSLSRGGTETVKIVRSDRSPWKKKARIAQGDNSYCLVWESASDVRLGQEFAETLDLDLSTRTAVNSLLTEIWNEYTEREHHRTEYSRAADGHLVAEIGDVAKDRNRLANEFWSKLGKIVSDAQRKRIFRSFKTRSDRAFDEIWKSESDAYPTLLGWSKDNSPVRVEIRKHNDRFHWYVRPGSHGVTGNGERLPFELEHYFTLGNEQLEIVETLSDE